MDRKTVAEFLALAFGLSWLVAAALLAAGVDLTGSSNVWTSPVGVAGIGAAALATAVCEAHDRLTAAEPITTGERLSPWSDASTARDPDGPTAAPSESATE